MIMSTPVLLRVWFFAYLNCAGRTRQALYPLPAASALYYKHQVTVGNLPPDWLKTIRVTNQTCRSGGII
jgi:hypothetical protein